MIVRELLDRIYRSYLEPPDFQPAASWLNANIDADVTEVPLTQFQIPEDEELVRIGCLIEIDYELMRTVGYNQTSRTVTVQRGVDGTERASHSAGRLAILSPKFARQTAFEQLGDNITSLSPHLFQVRTELLSCVAPGVAAMPDDLALSVVRARPEDAIMGHQVEVQAEIVDYHPLTDGRAVLFSAFHGDAWVTWRRRMRKPISDQEELTKLGVDIEWVTALMARVAADMMIGKDIARSHTNWVSQSLETQGIRVGQRTQIAISLRQYSDVLLREFRREMTEEYAPTVTINDAFGNVVR